MVTLKNKLVRPVVGWEGLYVVTKFGDVIRLRSRNGKRKVLKQVMKTNGYMQVTLAEKPRRVDVLVHIIVAEAFLGPCPIGAEVNHIDGRKSNNRLTNLEYLTRKENYDHAIELGLLIYRDNRWRSPSYERSE